MSQAAYDLLPLDRYDEIPAGEDAAAYDATKYFGREGFHEDVDLSDRNRPLLSGMKIKTRLVRNSHSTTLARGTVVKFDAGEFMEGVVPAGAGDTPHGVVPWYMPASVPVGAMFSMIVHGPAKIEKASGEILEGAFVVTAASGRIDDETAGDYTNDKSEVGYALETSSATAGTGQRVFVNLD